MKATIIAIALCLVGASVSPALAAGRYSTMSYHDSYGDGRFSEFTINGGLSGINKNDTGFRDSYVNIPVGANLLVGLNRAWAMEGDFSWFLPVKQSVNLANGVTADRKSPDVLTYQANATARMYMEDNAWLPYVTAGVGGMSFLKNTDPDREPRLSENVNMFAANFGVGTGYRMGDDWSVKVDFREFVGFPSDNAAGLSSGGHADKIWMERGTVGLSKRF